MTNSFWTAIGPLLTGGLLFWVSPTLILQSDAGGLHIVVVMLALAIGTVCGMILGYRIGQGKFR